MRVMFLLVGFAVVGLFGFVLLRFFARAIALLLVLVVSGSAVLFLLTRILGSGSTSEIVIGVVVIILGFGAISKLLGKERQPRKNELAVVIRPAVSSAEKPRRDFSIETYKEDLARLVASFSGNFWTDWLPINRETPLECAWLLFRKHIGDQYIKDANYRCNEFMILYPELPLDLKAAELASHISNDIPAMAEKYLHFAMVADAGEKRERLNGIADRLHELARQAERFVRMEAQTRDIGLRDAIEHPHRKHAQETDVFS